MANPDRGRTVRTAVAVVVISLVAVACSGASGSRSRTGPTIGLPESAINVITETKTAAIGKAYSFGALIVCAHRTTRPLQISSVTLPKGASGLKIADFGTRPNPFQHNREALGTAAGTTSNLGFHSKSVVPCIPRLKGNGEGPFNTTELAVTLRSTAPIGTTKGFVMSYNSDGVSRSFSLQFGLTICTAAATRTHKAECHP